MERRLALKNLAAATLGLVALPAWANNWTQTTLLPILPPASDALLADLVETIIPTTDTPGAKSLGVNLFVQRMVADCYDKPTQTTFANGLTTVDELAKKATGQSFTDSTPVQRLAVVKAMMTSTDPQQKAFYNLVIGLTVRGYMTSEYVMTNLTHFQMAPGYYKGCVPVVAKAVSTTSSTK